MKWSLQRALNLTDAEVQDAETRAARIEEACKPDGARQYIPLTEAGRVFELRRYLARETMKELAGMVAQESEPKEKPEPKEMPWDSPGAWREWISQG